jgi:omega-6 fatty acid desaturase (delta-12 desaturase)
MYGPKYFSFRRSNGGTFYSAKRVRASQEVPYMSPSDSNAAQVEPFVLSVPQIKPRAAKPAWVSSLKQFEKPNAMKVTLQLVDTLIPYAALWALMYLTMSWGLPYWATLLVALPASALMLRLFIFFHDCCHGSYLASELGMKIIGNILGVLVFTPYAYWRHSHGVHHSTAGNLDRRGVGDVWTMTAEEYADSTRFKRLQYRLFRNPLIMFGLGPIYSFLIMQRIPSHASKPNQVVSVLLTDLALAAIVVTAGLTIGVKAYLMIQLPILLFGGAAGVWLFYVQHQFDPSYWERNETWESMESAMQGSSYYKLPKVFQWISASIGLHHVHHLRPRIPNYNLQLCLNEIPELQLPNPLTLRTSLRSVRLKLWDEKRKLLLSFREMALQMRQGRPMA